MTKRRNGAGAKPAPGRTVDRHNLPSIKIRAPKAALDLLREAAAAEGYPLNRWAAEVLVATAADDLGRDAVASLGLLDEPE